MKKFFTILFILLTFSVILFSGQVNAKIVSESDILNRKYDYMIVGSGLSGSVFAYEAGKKGKSCLVIEKRNHIGGNVYTENVEGINVHKYGAHIFHTNNKEIWNYMNQFAEFNGYINSPIAIYKGEVYNLPFNMNTFYKMWGVVTPEEARKIIASQVEKSNITNPKNLEEQAISLVGHDIYEKLVKGYTEKQWEKSCKDLPPFIIRRLPVRFSYNNNYFNDKYQGIPIGGYTQIIEKMLQNSDVLLQTDYFDFAEKYPDISEKIVYTGEIDKFYNYEYGKLDYRSLSFESQVLDIRNFQGNAVVNYTDRDVPFTRIIEHKHFEFGSQEKTVITREYPQKFDGTNEPYYPINDSDNMGIFKKYQDLASSESKVIFIGRLALYSYLDMDKVIEQALSLAEEIL